MENQTWSMYETSKKEVSGASKRVRTAIAKSNKINDFASKGGTMFPANEKEKMDKWLMIQNKEGEQFSK